MPTALVLGAGIIGTATAYELQRAGFAVTLIDRQGGVARETSAANGGVVAPGYVTPWAAPGMPIKVAKSLFAKEAPVVFRPRLDGDQWRWAFKWLRECTHARYKMNKPRMQRIAHYSRIILTETRQRLGVPYDRTEGLLQLFRTAKDEAMAAPALRMLEAQGTTFRLLDRAGCEGVEPALAHSTAPLHGGVYLPDDEAGDCAKFAGALADAFTALGGVFLGEQRIEAILPRSGRAPEVVLAGESPRTLSADVVVVALGVESVRLLRPLGIDVPLYPIKGYSLTLPVIDGAFAPKGALMDEAYKVVLTRMGDRLRIAGTAEVSDWSSSAGPDNTRTLLKMAREWFGKGVDLSAPDVWVGRRPMTPDGPPVLGATPVPGLLLNIGHGSTGWAMSMGSARVIADLACARLPEIDLEGLTLRRYAPT